MAIDCLIEITGPDVKGESSLAHGKDLIEAISFSHGVAHTLSSGASNTSRASGRASVNDVSITQHLDISFPTLNLLCCSGQDVKRIRALFYKADSASKPLLFLEYNLESCIITSVSMSASPEGLPIVQYSINFQKISWMYGKQLSEAPGGQKGKSQTTWSIKENKGG